jgi:hypothetical protein
VQAQGSLLEQRSIAEREKLSMKEKFDEAKVELQQSKGQLLAKQLEVKERVKRALRSVTIVKVQTKERVP